MAEAYEVEMPLSWDNIERAVVDNAIGRALDMLEGERRPDNRPDNRP